jgi:hypothetical protein
MDEIDYTKLWLFNADQNHPSKEKFIRYLIWGACGCFKPHFIQNKGDLNLNLYDVNSLYPYVARSPMPVVDLPFVKAIS